MWLRSLTLYGNEKTVRRMKALKYIKKFEISEIGNIFIGKNDNENQ